MRHLTAALSIGALLAFAYGSDIAAPLLPATGLAQAQSNEAPNPRLILRDSSGTPVEAIVNVSCPANDLSCGTFRPLEEFPCAWIQVLEGRTVGVNYSLSSGRVDACEPSFDSFRNDPAALFLDDRCEGEAVAVDSGAGLVRTVDGTLYAPTEAQTTRQLYNWNPESEQCEAIDLSDNEVQVWRFVSVPSWVSEALPNPPYTLTMEY